MVEYFTYKEAMNYLGINSYQGLRNLFNAGLPIIQVGKTKKISKSAIDQFMKEHQQTVNN